MNRTILLETFGQIHQVSVFNFFITNPLHKVRASKLSKFLDISRDTLRKDLNMFEKQGIIVRDGKTGPYSLNHKNKSVNVTVSIGTADSSNDASSPWDVLKLSDKALYRAKAKGRNRVCV